jgi:hypothetical protein
VSGREREREMEREGESGRERGRARGREGEQGREGGRDVTSWYPSRTKAVLIKLRRKTFTWMIRA